MNRLANVRYSILIYRLTPRDVHEALFGPPAELIPNNSFGNSTVGNVLAGLGRADEAIAYYRKALEIDPNDVEAHNNLGNALADSGRLDEAIEQYRVTLKLDRSVRRPKKALAGRWPGWDGSMRPSTSTGKRRNSCPTGPLCTTTLATF